MKTKTKKVLLTLGGAVGAAGLFTAAYVMFNKPSHVEHTCPRTFTRGDGKPKIAFQSPRRANFQSVKQLFLHGEVCNPYEANGKYYTGHSKNAFIKSINPFKH